MQDLAGLTGLRDARPIRQFENGCIVGYCQGNFDNWCIFLRDERGKNHFPHDAGYFMKLKKYKKRFGEQVYQDFVKIRDMTDKTVNLKVLKTVRDISEKYEDLALEVEIIFDILYLAMIAEENKKNSRLGKRIKALGVYNVLKEDMDCYDAANYMKRMCWRDIDGLCAARGI